MSFETPQRQKSVYNDVKSESVKRVPLGLMFETNRGMLQSGAQRVLVKEKEIKIVTPAPRSKSNFMKVTEAFRNGYNPISSKSVNINKHTENQLSGTKNMSTPTSITHAHSGAKKKPNVAVGSVVKPSGGGVVVHTHSTPIRETPRGGHQRSSSTPPSSRRPVLSEDKDGGEKRSGRLFSGSKSALRDTTSDDKAVSSTILFSPESLRKADRSTLDETPQRAVSASRTRPSTLSAGGASGYPTSHRIEFRLPMDEEQEQSSKPSQSPFYDLRQHSKPHSPHLNTPVSDKGIKALLTPSDTHAISATQHPQSKSSKSVHHAEAVAAQQTPTASKASHKAHNNLHSHSHTPIKMFKNPPPKSLIVTTADTLSANKAAKKAVIASIKAISTTSAHHYSAPTHSSSAASAQHGSGGTPSRKTKSTPTSTSTAVTPPSGHKFHASEEKRLSLTPSRKERSAADHTPLRMVASDSVGSAAETNKDVISTLLASQKGITGSAKRTTKKKKVTISGSSPTVHNPVVVALSQESTSNTAGGGQQSRDMDIDSILRNLAPAHSSDKNAKNEYFDLLRNSVDTRDMAAHTMLSLQPPEPPQSSRGDESGSAHEDDFGRHVSNHFGYELRKSLSFGSELSSVRGYADADLSLADTINLSTNLSHFDHNPSPSLALDTPISALTTASGASRQHRMQSSGGNQGNLSDSIHAFQRDTLARLQLDENLMDLSAVEGPQSCSESPNQFSAANSFGSFSAAFTPIPVVEARRQSQQRPAARHHHNTATATSRSTDMSNFYAQYSGDNVSVNRSQSGSLLRKSLTGQLHLLPHSHSENDSDVISVIRPVSALSSGHLVAGSPSFSQTPQQLSRMTSLECEEEGRGSVDSSTFFRSSSAQRESPTESERSELNRGMLVDRSGAESVLSCSASVLTADKGMMMSFSESVLSVASVASNVRAQSRLFSASTYSIRSTLALDTSAANTPHSTAGVSVFSPASTLNRGMLQDEFEDVSMLSTADFMPMDNDNEVDEQQPNSSSSSIDTPASASEINTGGGAGFVDSQSAISFHDEQNNSEGLDLTMQRAVHQLDALQIDECVSPDERVRNSVAPSVQASLGRIPLTREPTAILSDYTDVHSVDEADSGHFSGLRDSNLFDDTNQLDGDLRSDHNGTMETLVTSSVFPVDALDGSDKGSSNDAPNMESSGSDEAASQSVQETDSDALLLSNVQYLDDTKTLQFSATSLLLHTLRHSQEDQEEGQNVFESSFDFSQGSGCEQDDMVNLSDAPHLEEDLDQLRRQSQLSSFEGSVASAAEQAEERNEEVAYFPCAGNSTILQQYDNSESFSNCSALLNQQFSEVSGGPDSLDQHIMSSAVTGCPPLTNVCESFEFQPRSAASLPMPVTVSSAPVTKSYRDIEKGGARQKFNSLLAHTPVRDFRVEESSQHQSPPSGEFVSSLPRFEDLLDQRGAGDKFNESALSRVNTSNMSVTSSKRSGVSSSASVASHTSSVDELQRLNPGIKSESWTAAHYGAMRSGVYTKQEVSEISEVSSVVSSFSESLSAYQPQRSVYETQHFSTASTVFDASVLLLTREDSESSDPLAELLASDAITNQHHTARATFVPVDFTPQV